MPAPNQDAIAEAEHLLRRLRTGELTGFVAVATDDVVDAQGVAMTFADGTINLLQAAGMLRELSQRHHDAWVEAFDPVGDKPMLTVPDDKA